MKGEVEPIVVKSITSKALKAFSIEKWMKYARECGIYFMESPAPPDRVLYTITTIRNSFPDAVEVYTRGGCYQFYLILQSIYPEAVAYYDDSHIITKINENYYDITGKVKRENHLEVNIHYDHDKLMNQLKYK